MPGACIQEGDGDDGDDGGDGDGAEVNKDDEEVEDWLKAYV